MTFVSFYIASVIVTTIMFVIGSYFNPQPELGFLGIVDRIVLTLLPFGNLVVSICIIILLMQKGKK